jgi:hypothetical protein
MNRSYSLTATHKLAIRILGDYLVICVYGVHTSAQLCARFMQAHGYHRAAASNLHPPRR